MGVSRHAGGRGAQQGAEMTTVDVERGSFGVPADRVSPVVVDEKETKETGFPGSRGPRGQTRSRSARRLPESTPLLGISKLLMAAGVVLVSLMATRIVLCLHGQVHSKVTARGLFSGTKFRRLSDGKRSANTPQLLSVTALDPNVAQSCYLNPAFISGVEGVPSSADTQRPGYPLAGPGPAVARPPRAAPAARRSWVGSSVGLLGLGTVLVGAGFAFLAVALALSETATWAGALAGVFFAASLIWLSYVFLTRRSSDRGRSAAQGVPPGSPYP